MCTYQTERVTVQGSGKGASGWFPLTDASVYFDHPVHASADHTVNLDFLNPGRGPAARVAVELDPANATFEEFLAELNRLPHLIMRRFGNHFCDRSLRGFPQNSGGLAIFVAVDVPALRIAAGQRNASQLQGPCIGDRDMPIDAPQKNRMSA